MKISGKRRSKTTVVSAKKPVVVWMFHDVDDRWLDPRTVNLFMMDSPVPSALICLGYLVVVYLGPKFMANRPAYNIRELLLAYNFAMVLLSGYLFYEVDTLHLSSPRSDRISPVVFSRWMVKWLFARLSTCRLFSITTGDEGKSVTVMTFLRSSSD